ncbi:hypothetical protein J3B02_004225 [Coemansia erecta]|uniref:Uncharacterized protein n=1 Tax=Coemansia asiatica TaxID=1052880 RepID=A0A9W7XHW1_9FUNG|nr:hypothetical protein LPJ64_004675 [Coemansia asiatica]KAJ2847178.1 hypothetical protein J3B02_004225 [Coemansia erecta]KAJ2878303.1 hypothetical protein FB639_003428 [Coemansia asiatica]
MTTTNTQPCAFAHIAGTKIQILPLSSTILANGDKSIVSHVTKSMNWSAPGIPVLLYPCDYQNNFLSQPPAKIHCFIQPHVIPTFFHLLESNNNLVFVNDHPAAYPDSNDTSQQVLEIPSVNKAEKSLPASRSHSVSSSYSCSSPPAANMSINNLII